MPTAIALIRGINVGSTRSLPMKQLCELCVEAGLKNPRTYIQSGNVAFIAAKRDLSSAARKLEDAIEGARGFRPSVILRTREELAAAIEANPFAARAKAEPAKLLIMFLHDKPAAGAADAIQGVKRDAEQLRLIGRELFIDFPNGIGRSKLALPALEKALGTPGTTRNWNTTLKLLAIADELAGT
jgi:uncharacterized protein (DUF1697 family)